MLNMLGLRRGGGGSPSAAGDADASPAPGTGDGPAGPARPLRLVYCDDKGRFVMDPEAVAALQLVKGPVGVVSVCGRARQGKSFVLNQLLGRSSGFQVASTHRPCTKGLWMWSTPLKRTGLDGTEYSLVLLDTEGIDAYDQTGTYSIQIFSLAVLLSSMFIYNQMGGIDEAALDRLSLVTEMTKHIRVRASGGKSTASELGQFAPVFVWLLRDFYLDLTEDNRKITPRDYLELALRPVQGGGRDVSAKNAIRESIRALFPDRECFTLVRPVNNEKDLQRLDQLPLSNFRPEFRSGLDAFTKFVLDRTRPKQLGASTMTGPILAGLTQSFLDAINSGTVPVISSSWQGVEEAECQRAYDTAVNTYNSSFDRKRPVEEDLPSELKKLRHDPPSYVNLLHDIFDGVVVDGSTAYVPGQAEVDAEEDDDDDDDDACMELPGEDSPMTSGSSTSSTGISHLKWTESPMVRIFSNREKKWQHMEQQAKERRKKEEQQAEERRKKEHLLSTIDMVQKLAFEAGVQRGSAEHLAVGVLGADEVMRQLFFTCQTADERLQFIQHYMRLKQLF